MTASALNPRIIHRECGGWLALSPPDEALRIGVVASTQDAAEAQYRASLAQWRLAFSEAANRTAASI